jgi:hypothetical protein
MCIYFMRYNLDSRFTITIMAKSKKLAFLKDTCRCLDAVAGEPIKPLPSFLEVRRLGPKLRRRGDKLEELLKSNHRGLADISTDLVVELSQMIEDVTYVCVT